MSVPTPPSPLGSALSRRAMMRGAVLLGAGTALGGIELLSATPALAVTTPTIASCATWGARDPSSTLTQISTNPDKILIHHTATANSTDYSLSHAYSLARSIQDYHMDVNGWSDTGQHFTVSRGGYMMEGRHYSLSHLTSGSGMVVGAHCPGQNDKAIGIENEGTYTSVTPTTALYNNLVQLCAYICSKYGIAATEIYGHRDFYSTACPGDAFYAMLPQLRTDVAAALSGGGTSFTVTIDNTSSSFRASTNWGTSTYSSQRYGADYRYANPVAASDAAYYSATLPSAGNYKIETWYPANTGYNASTPYVVFTSSGSQTVTVNQQVNGGKWNTVGTFAFAGGTQDVVAVSRWTSGTGYVIADAMRITAV
jgi:N-acetylmuramoyl-L-alanine amidase